MTATQLANWIAGGALLINTVALLFLIMQLRLVAAQVRQAKDAFIAEQDRARKQATMEYLANTSDLRKGMAGKLPGRYKLAEVQRSIDESTTDKDKEQELISFLNYYEAVSAAVNTGVFDLEVADRTVGGILLTIDGAYGEYIRRVQIEGNAPSIWQEIPRLAARIRGRRSAAGDAAPSHAPSR
jgi:hypothetical protein